jgi:hypothetical protein
VDLGVNDHHGDCFLLFVEMSARRAHKRSQSSQAVIEIAFCKASQRIVDLQIDLDPFAHQSRTGSIARSPGMRISSIPDWRGVALIVSIRWLTSRRYSSSGTKRSGLKAMNR